MKRTWLLALGFTVLVFSSCELLYSGKNLFASLDGPDVQALKTATGPNLIDKLKDNKGGESGSFGDTFVEKLKGDPGAADTIYNNLEGIFTSSSSSSYDTNTRAEAALLAADLVLAVSDSAGPVVNNVVSAVLNLANDTSTEAFTPDELLVYLLGPVASDRDSFLQLVADMEKIADAYDALGEALSSGATITLDAGDGQAALVAFTLQALVGAVQVTGTTEAKAIALYDSLISPALNGEEITSDTINALFSTNPTSPNGADKLQLAFESVLNPTDSALSTLYTATGINGLIDLLSGGN
uniref:Uncharacterized protein n=1 Tax=Gracilinema caldarium TaxID=215591 RepID=A0A7C3HW00_9SPIR